MRITSHPSLRGKSLNEKMSIIPSLTGIFDAEDWTKKDVRTIKTITQELDHLSGKTFSTKFYELLIEYKSTYNKFCFFARSPKHQEGLLKAITCAVENRFCTNCDACFVTAKSGICYPCSQDNPSLAKTAKNEQIGRSNREAWNDTERNIVGKRSAKLLAAEGITNGMQRASSVAKRKKTLKENYGKDWQQKIIDKVKETNLERYGVEFQLQRSEIREAGEETRLKLYGERHAMQVPQFLKKAFEVSRRIHNVVIDGKKYRVQGKSAEALLRRLITKYGHKSVHTEFSPTYPEDAFTEMRTFPDFYLSSLDIFIECKSWWTFMGSTAKNKAKRMGAGSIKLNKKKASLAEASGNVVRWVIHYAHKKKDHFFILPPKWYLLKCKELRKMVNKFIDEVRDGQIITS